jgi:hypothetical protein
MTTNAEPLPASLRGAAWTSALAWLPLTAGLTLPAFAGPDLLSAMPMLSRVALLVAALFLIALAGAAASWRRPCGHARSVAHVTAASSFFGVVAAAALFAFSTVAAAPGVGY